jgi:tRNA threonylcarbamoyladenosine biosynthesis protein TsaB
VLALDASTYEGTVALLRAGEVVATRAVAMRGEREERLLPAVVALLDDSGVASLGAVICGAGPGSFTSLRIAASIAKALAYGRRVPLYAVPSLALIVAGAKPAIEPGNYVATLDAMRGDVYCRVLERRADGVVVSGSDDMLVAAGALPALAEEHRARLIGPGREIERAPHARGAAALLDSIALAGSVDLASWEPAYGRKAEAQVKWESVHGRALPSE